MGTAHAAGIYRCSDTGTGVITTTGGNLFSARQVSYTFTSLDALCDLPDPTIHSGSEVGTGAGTLDCGHLNGSFRGSFTEYWDNGRTSTGTFTERVVAGVDHTVGVFTGGEFEGLKSVYLGLDLPTNPQNCLPESSLIFGTFAGQFLFGDMPPEPSGSTSATSERGSVTPHRARHHRRRRRRPPRPTR